ncbi:NUDIX hydrolase [Pseudonocardia alni]|uniref:NUDIX hydrolase n=1 Tax=Pseudonocardia alni TaxID=33907 RepID=UPI0033E0B918
MSYVGELRSLVGTRPLILPGSSVVVVDAGRILLVRRADTGDWGLPGGLMDPGESFEEAAHREVREEVGIGITELRLLDVFSGADYYYRYPHGDEVYNVTAAYTAAPVSRELTVDPAELASAEFVELDRLPNDILPPERPIIDRYVRLARG